MPTHTKISHAVLAKTLALLQTDEAVTAKKLHLKTGVHYVTATAWLRALRNAGTVHIVGWEKDSLGRDAIPVYRLGSGEDKPRNRKTGAERMREYRKRRKKESEVECA